MARKTVLVSGGSSGVGLAAAKGLAALGARTILLSRSAGRGARAVRAVQAAAPGADVSADVADLTSGASVAALMERLAGSQDRIDVLVNATGSVGERGELRPGISRSFATNYFSHFLLTRAALPLLRESLEGRVLTVGVAPFSVRRMRDFPVDRVDANAAATAVLTQSVGWKLLLSRYLSETEQTVGAAVFHPGLIKSELLDRQALPLRLIGGIANRFAASTCAVVNHLASRPSDGGTVGGMFDNHARVVPLPAVITSQNAGQVWRTSVEAAAQL